MDQNSILQAPSIGKWPTGYPIKLNQQFITGPR